MTDSIKKCNIDSYKLIVFNDYTLDIKAIRYQKQYIIKKIRSQNKTCKIDCTSKKFVIEGNFPSFKILYKIWKQNYNLKKENLNIFHFLA